MSGLINYLSCGALLLGLAARLPDLSRDWRNPFLRTICSLLGLASLCFLLGAPPTVGAINSLSGVPNLAAPLTYAAITAYGAASLVLIVHWRGGPNVRRTARSWVLAYTFVLVGIATLFALGDASRERRADFDTYYADTAYIREMIVLYLAAHLTAVCVTSAWCLSWAREVDGWLRAGLLTMGVGTVINAGYSISKIAALVAGWSGRDWSRLSTEVSPGLAGLGALLTVTGVVVPLLGPTLSAWRRNRRSYVRLAPLERELDDVLTRHSLRLRRPYLSIPGMLLTWRQTSIHNALFHLDGYFDRTLYEDTLAASLEATGDAERAEAEAWAVIIVAAVRRERDGHTPDDSGRMANQTPEASTLEGIADALATSPLVLRARGSAGDRDRAVATPHKSSRLGPSSRSAS
ncbi:MAB_1171c family putative transporter [Streptomyces fructofermentans]|uniref:DUF6545 domain-containing protein n=1 Tax=Streptomyces fructofermentans TaxID=152141 RepID=A0A918NN81_9ACTN|nr:MAB_1171c family putative transporter [Streptomyces fructofermentans]GGX82661.1 hypothetical protein GCM10010515_57770 [Streptomyces fructofermentans]